MKNRIRKPRLVNAKKMNEEYPDSFYFPEEDISNLRIGDIVKVCNGWDRFWVVLTKIDGELLEGDVNNYLVGDILTGKGVSYNYGDKIAFNKHHIYEVWDKEGFLSTKGAIIK